MEVRKSFRFVWTMFFGLVCSLPLWGNQADIIAYMSKGDYFREQKMSDSARIYYAKAYGRFTEHLDEKSKHLCAIAYLQSAKICYYSSNFPEGLDLYLKGLKIIEECAYKERISEFYIGMADVYWLNQDLEMAGHCYEKGYVLSVQYKDTAAELNIANNLTGIYCYLQEHDKARKYMAISNRLNRDTVTQKYLNLLHEGLMLVNDQQYEKAASLFRVSGYLAVDHGMHPKFACSSYEELYKLFMKTGQPDSVKYYLLKCYDILQETPMINMLPLCLRNLSKMYRQERNFQKAYEFKDKYYAVMDSIFRFRDINRLRNIQTVYEAEKTDHKIVQLQEQRDRKEQIIQKQWLTILGMIVILIISGVVSMYIYRQKQKVIYLYKKLFDVNRMVMESEQYNKRLRIKYEEQLRQKAMNGIEESPNIAMSENACEESMVGRQKYVGSRLNEEQKLSIAMAIESVMDTTLEFCETDFSLDKLALLVNSNSTYVSQVINETYHKNFNLFINEYRIREARKRLADSETYGNYTIKTISESVGFRSQTTFIKMFREFTGMTPSMFLKMKKNEEQ